MSGEEVWVVVDGPAGVHVMPDLDIVFHCQAQDCECNPTRVDQGTTKGGKAYARSVWTHHRCG